MSPEPQSKLTFPLDEDKQEVPTPKILAHKKQIPLLFPYAERSDAKTLGAKWNSVDKFWYYPSIEENFPKNYSNTANTMFL